MTTKMGGRRYYIYNWRTMKISIVTVAYNSSKTLESTIRSVLAQTYKDIEYIVVDGGSDDGSPAILSQYEQEYGGRMRWVSEQDKGIYDAMNKGIAMATGDVVGILNSDDYFTSNDVIKKMVSSFSQPEVDAVYGDVHFVREGALDKVVRYYSSKMFSPFWLRFGFMPAHPSFYVRREVYEKAGGYKTDYQIGADFEMMVRLFKVHKLRAKYLPMDFVTMRVGGASTKNLRSHITLLREDARACRENGIYTNQWMIALKYLYKVLEYRL